MDAEPWRKNFRRNAATNYLSTIVRLGVGLVVFRLLFQRLDHEQFGYYSLLWSLFGYAVLLDFGFGFTMQKVVAQKVASGDTQTLNRLVSTIVWSFVAVGLSGFALFALIKPWFLGWIHVAPMHRSEFGTAYLVFFAALAINFPIGLFPEMLRGLQRMDVINWITIVSQLANLALMTWGLLAHWPFLAIVSISVGTTVAMGLVAFFFVRRLLPGLSLHPRNFHFPEVRGVLSFSLVAYLITFTNLVVMRADQAVISFSIGVSFVALYQVGYKASEMFGLFSRQIQEALTPAAAHLSAAKDRQALCELLFQTSRLTALLATPLYALCAAYLEPLVKILSGLKQVDASILWAGQMLLLATWTSIVLQSGPKRVMLMCGWERSLLKLSAAEAVLNLVLSVALVTHFGIAGVAFGTLAPALLLGCLGVLPLAARFVKMNYGQLLIQLFQPVLLPIGVSLVVLMGLLIVFPIPPTAGLLSCAWRGSLVLAAALVVALPPFLRNAQAKAMGSPVA
jgi:O-antigen/teichoic acid export membrane protein